MRQGGQQSSTTLPAPRRPLTTDNVSRWHMAAVRCVQRHSTASRITRHNMRLCLPVVYGGGAFRIKRLWRRARTLTLPSRTCHRHPIAVRWMRHHRGSHWPTCPNSPAGRTRYRLNSCSAAGPELPYRRQRPSHPSLQHLPSAPERRAVRAVARHRLTPTHLICPERRPRLPDCIVVG